MNDLPPYPPIDPTTFDLIVIGTGLPESIVAAAASTASKSVLHLDPNPFYGSHFSSIPLTDLSSFLSFHSTSPSPSPSPSSNGHHDFTALDFAIRPLYSSLDISNFSPQLLDQHSRRFNIDVAGPRVLFCADKSIDLMLKSGASQYMEFKSIDASFVGDDKGNLWSVPDSRAAIFKDKSLGLMEKNQLMRFFKLVQGHLAGEEGLKISEEDLESPFVDFLNKMGLPPKIKSFILYAIAMADYDQEDVGVCQDLLKTKDGIDQLALYNASVGRFSNALGALIYPVYGQGELSQAFCRRAAVKGCLYVLRMPVTSLLVDKDSGCYKGVRLASGQDIFSKKLILDPSFTVPLPLGSPSPHPLQEKLPLFSLRDDRGKVARGICITKTSLKPDVSNFLVVYPPRSLFPEQVTSIRLLQMGSNLAVCPPDMFVIYISALCTDDDQGKKLLHAVMNTLVTLPVSTNSESNAAVQSESAESGGAALNETAESSFTDQNDLGEGKPTLLWSALYIQKLTLGQVDFICSGPMPDGKLNYNDLLDATVKLFQEIYPDEEFFPETSTSEFSEDDGGVAVET
ncbi:PREDICTED: rab escort protein 1 [Theobroma cacao]|uniref:Rab escort protein 1 n=1 Tax=Theobroma cacao TaxID=3641 RepID=A0AB32WJS3_THECC|nr:PREDICTED: rab escort protein 1 [Theobroma cacao]